MSPCGFTTIYAIDNVARRCRGSMWIHPDYRGGGIATEALKKRNAMLFDTLNMNRIESVASRDNGGSMKMLEAMGQTKEGILREAVYYDGKYHDLVCFATLRSERGSQGY